ncbi:MAG: hypothetical protein H6716_00040 [Polyangiaceae bacterium]|nr:hypothetical protein [Polyangiaceae bacterium]
MTSTHDDYDQHAREYAAGLLRDEAERMENALPTNPLADLRKAKRGAWFRQAADWLEAPR